ncbi:uncharacterized protein LOC126723451 isoform X3 [Quercus robur]|uniref:uncharacterized protein LOC126723451 isoform X3 n=1 Tax=Quercus robur TaxID=38942 RepID=UPI0021634AED|nr:uncharacterized protein LOC126723451 isoform X3 [Quercus robur]
MCDGLVSLPGIGSLTSLQILYIWGCHNLTSLPQEISNLTSLKLLTIEECPLLGQRCKRQIGEDWPIIAHVPIVDVDEWNQQEETISSESDLESESVCLLPEDELILQQPLQNLDYITEPSDAKPTEAKNKLGYKIRTLFKNCNCATSQELGES